MSETPTEDDVALVKAANQLAVSSGMSTEQAMSALTEAMGIRELRTELARLKTRLLDGQDLAATLAEGWWRTERGWMVDGKFQQWINGTITDGPTHQRRIWTGRITPIDAEADSALTETNG